MNSGCRFQAGEEGKPAKTGRDTHHCTNKEDDEASTRKHHCLETSGDFIYFLILSHLFSLWERGCAHATERMLMSAENPRESVLLCCRVSPWEWTQAVTLHCHHLDTRAIP